MEEGETANGKCCASTHSLTQSNFPNSNSIQAKDVKREEIDGNLLQHAFIV
jgi:hypothetical protein